MFSKKKCGMCGKKGSTTGTRVVPGIGPVEVGDCCKGFLDGAGDQPYNPARIRPAAGPMGGKYVGPPAKPQRRK